VSYSNHAHSLEWTWPTKVSPILARWGGWWGHPAGIWAPHHQMHTGTGDLLWPLSGVYTELQKGDWFFSWNFYLFRLFFDCANVSWLVFKEELIFWHYKNPKIMLKRAQNFLMFQCGYQLWKNCFFKMCCIIFYRDFSMDRYMMYLFKFLIVFSWKCIFCLFLLVFLRFSFVFGCFYYFLLKVLYFR